MEKALVSPFKYRTSNIECKNEKDSISYRELTKLQNKGILTSQHLYVLELIYKHKYLTRMMIDLLIQSDKNYLERLKTGRISTKSLIKGLVKQGVLLRKYIYWNEKIKSNDGASMVIKGTPNFYSLSRGGLSYFIKANRLKISIDKYMINDSPEEIFKKLSVNQLIANYSLKVRQIDNITSNFHIKSKRYDAWFQIYSLLTIQNEENDVQLIVESVRRSEQWEYKLNTKLQVLNDWILKYAESDIENNLLCTYPLIILLCEDDLHMQEVSKVINLPRENILFTTDVRQMNEALSKSLIKISNIEGKNCMIECEALFLK